MNLSSFQVLSHVEESSSGSLTIFQHVSKKQEVLIFREERARTDDKFKTLNEALNRRKKAESASLLRIFKSEVDSAEKTLHVLMEYSVFNLSNVRLRSFDCILRCILDVLKALAELESLGLSHGDVCPEMVLYFPKTKSFKLADRIFPMSAPFSFYRKRIECSDELYLAPKLFNDTANKSVKSLKLNYFKNDVFSVGLMTLKLLYPFIVKIPKFYSKKDKLFNTFEFVQLVNRLIKTAKIQKEIDLLKLIQSRFVCFNELQRITPSMALLDFQRFLAKHYTNFEETFLSQNILVDSQIREVMIKFDSNNENDQNDQNQSLSGLYFSGDLPTKRKEPLSAIQSSGNKQPLVRNQEQNATLASPKSKIDVENLSKQNCSPRSQPFGKNSQFEKVIDFKELQSQNEAAQQLTGDKKLLTSELSEHNTTKTINLPDEPSPSNRNRENADFDQIYEILVKIDVRKLKGTDPVNLKGKIFDLKNYSNLSLNFGKTSMHIRSQSFNGEASIEESRDEEHFYDSMCASSLNLNFFSRRNKSQNVQVESQALNIEALQNTPKVDMTANRPKIISPQQIDGLQAQLPRLQNVRVEQFYRTPHYQPEAIHQSQRIIVTPESQTTLNTRFINYFNPVSGNHSSIFGVTQRSNVHNASEFGPSTNVSTPTNNHSLRVVNRIAFDDDRVNRFNFFAPQF